MEFTETKVREAVNALLRGQDSVLNDVKISGTRGALGKIPLIPAKENISLTIVQKRIPRQKYRRLKCDLPKPFRKAGGCDVCLIVKDISKMKNFDQERGVEKFKELLRSAGVTGVTQVLTFSQLKGEYKPYEAKRKLLNRYDIFLTDNRIYGKLAQILGSKFFTKNKFPIPVDIADSSDLSDDIKSYIESTYLTIQGKGPQCSMEIGSADQSANDIEKNTLHAISFLKNEFPGGWQNIRSLYLKLGKLSLPIYIDNSSPNFLPVEKPSRTAGFSADPEEITTVKEGKVSISRSGAVKLLKAKKKKTKKPTSKKL